MAQFNRSTVQGAAWGAALLFWLLPPPGLRARELPSYPPASLCATCHVETYDTWSRTFHALAAIDPVFVEALERPGVAGERETKRGCLMCHSPTTALTGDLDLAGPLSREGVTCSFCHSVTGIDLEARTGRFTSQPGRLAVGRGAESGDAHFQDHPVVLTAEFCAGCHEWVNRNGLRILSTYSEWKGSSLPSEKTPCQSCHMPQVSGGPAQGQPSKAIGSSNLHFQMGGHSQTQLVSAARLDVAAEVRERRIHLEVAVTNAKAGHMLPTGLPNRKLKLLVNLYDREGELLERRSQVFSRIIANAQGQVLEDITDQFLHGARELADNRIAPKETRRQRYVFDRPPQRNFLLVEASLEYDIYTPYLVPPVLNFKIVTKRLPLTLGEGGGGPRPLALTIPIAVFLVVTASLVALLYRCGRGNSPGGRKE